VVTKSTKIENFEYKKNNLEHEDAYQRHNDVETEKKP
jgi:hypothetical protein